MLSKKLLSTLPLLSRFVTISSSGKSLSSLSLLKPFTTFGGGTIRSLSSASQDTDHVASETSSAHIALPTEYPLREQKGAPQKISKIDVEKYLYPLLCHGWKINSGLDKSVVLQRGLVFKGPISARKFLLKLFDVEEILWHHANSIHLNGEKRPTLTLTIQTHDLTPSWISLQDIRLAATLERSYREGDFAPVKGKTALQVPTPLAVESWTKLLQSYPWEKDGASIVDNTYR